MIGNKQIWELDAKVQEMIGNKQIWKLDRKLQELIGKKKLKSCWKSTKMIGTENFENMTESSKNWLMGKNWKHDGKQQKLIGNKQTWKFDLTTAKID